MDHVLSLMRTSRKRNCRPGGFVSQILHKLETYYRANGFPLNRESESDCLRNGMPIFVGAPTSTIDIANLTEKPIEIEKRPAEEGPYVIEPR